MIQRKQTLFLLLAIVLAVVCMSSQVGTLSAEGIVFAKVYNLWISDGQGNRSLANWPMLALLLVAAVTSLVAIFMYTKRKLQALLCLVTMMVYVAWYILVAVLPQWRGGDMTYHWPVVLPAICIILTFMARKGILADEKLVRSLDRIR
jgi:hypothetical protein